MPTQAMSKLFLKFWVEQSELMEQAEKNGGTFLKTFSEACLLFVEWSQPS